METATADALIITDLPGSVDSPDSLGHVDSNITTQGLLSYAAREIFMVVNHVVLSSGIGLFGLAANTINVCVFYRQGLDSSINISFFALTISDLFSLVSLEWMNICLNPFIDRLDSIIIFKEVQFLTAGILHVCAARITSCVTAYITAERCLSIVLPLKVKQIVTARRTAAIITTIFVINASTLIPEYSAAYLDWKFYPPKNATMVGLQFRSYKQLAESLLFIFHAALAVFSFLTTVIFTVILVVKLKSSAKWRKTSASESKKAEMTSSREKKTMTMIVLVATNLIVFYTPTVAFCVVLPVFPEFSIAGRESNLFEAVWSFAFLCHSINSSVNIFLYHRMSSNYRSSLMQMLTICGNRTQRGASSEENDQATLQDSNFSNITAADNQSAQSTTRY